MYQSHQLFAATLDKSTNECIYQKEARGQSISSKSNSVLDFFLLRVNWLFLLCLQIELCNLVLKSSQNLAELWHMANKLPGSASRGEWRGPWFGFNLPFLLICFVSSMNEDWGIVFLTSSGWKGLIKSLYKRWHGF